MNLKSTRTENLISCYFCIILAYLTYNHIIGWILMILGFLQAIIYFIRED